MSLTANPYFRLMRLQHPVGFWLCYWPSVWALLLADSGGFRWDLALLFLLGAVSTRAAGCIVNDMADRDFDKHVERTKTRPLASGELSMRQAAVCLFALLVVALGVLLAVYKRLEVEVSFTTLFLAALPVLALSTAYPFMKRITWWPQAFLGLTFNWGVFIGWVAIRGTVEWPALLLYSAAFFWTLGYDTVYGYQDMKDDEKIGVKSTSRLMARHTRYWLSGFYAAMVALLAIAVHHQAEGMMQTALYAGLLFMAMHFAWQVKTLDASSPANCLRRFKSNAWLGGLWLIPAFLFQIV